MTTDMGCGDSRPLGTSDTSSEPLATPLPAQIQDLGSASSCQGVSQTRPPPSQRTVSPSSQQRSRTTISSRKRYSIEDSDLPISAAALQQLQLPANTPIARYAPLYSSEQDGQDRPLASRLLGSRRAERRQSPSRTERSRTPEPPLRTRPAGSSSTQEHRDGGRPFSRTLENIRAMHQKGPSSSQRKIDPNAPEPEPKPASAKEQEPVTRQSPPPTPPKATKPPPAPSAGARFRKSFEVEQLGSPAAKLQQQSQPSPFSSSPPSASASVSTSGSSSKSREPSASRFAPDGSSDGCSSRGHRLGARYQCPVPGCACKVGCRDPDCEICNIVKFQQRAVPKRSK